MITLFGKNEKETLEIKRGFRTYRLENGNLLLLAEPSKINVVWDWYTENGLAGVGQSEFSNYSECAVVSLDHEKDAAIEFFR